jgi:rod shape-determining protein MreD
MSETKRNGTGVILVTLAVSLLLTILPMPRWTEDFRPQWVAMTLIYWALALPGRIGVFWAWGVGLVLDVTSGTVLGQHALSLSVPVYLAVELHQRIRIFPLPQQAVSVWVLLLVERLLSLWVLGATGQPTPTLWYWMPTFVGMLLWPWLFVLLRDLRRRFAVV